MKKARSPVGFAHFRKLVGKRRGSTLVLGLGKTYWGAAGFPFAALFKEFHTLEALKDGTFAADGGV